MIKNGDFLQADFFDNTGGLNLTDSPFRVGDNQATGGYCFDYTATGGIKKRNAHTLANASPDAQLRTLGWGLHNTAANVKTILRAAGTKIQSVDSSTYACTNLAEDTSTAGTDFLNSSSTQPVVMAQFNTSSLNSMWMSGGGMSSVYGYDSSHITKNGVVSPTASAFTATRAALGGSFPSTGTLWYGLAYRKAGTQALSNVALDTSVTLSATTDTVNLAWTLTNNDTTKYDKIYIYRSAINGVTGFTTGDIVAELAPSATSYADTGTSVASTQNVPRANNTILDNSTLPSGTFNCLTLWKRRLVTATGSTLYISDLNKPESWPATNTLTVPSGGSITALGVISFTTPTTSAIDEFLVVLKERELWVLTGTSSTDWSLKFIDFAGCPGQSLVVPGNGFIAWMDYRGAYLWDGASKPIYASRPIEFAFGADGDLDKSKLTFGCGTFHRKQNQIIWFLSSSQIGEQMYALKLDLRLTLPQIASNLGSRVLEGVFTQDKTTFPIYSALSIYPTWDEILIAGDASGKIWKLFDNASGIENSGGVPFTYETKVLDLGLPGITKRIHKVIAWCLNEVDAALTLNYWTNYRNDAASEKTVSGKIVGSNIASLWDLSFWDEAYWDQGINTYTPVVFNLTAEGDALKLQFAQSTANTPLMIAGFSILFTTLGTRK